MLTQHDGHLPVSKLKEAAMPLPIAVVDAFTSQPFRGNPAAVCILHEPKSDSLLQSIAAEMNLAETAFLLREGECWKLRWFTPVVEVDLCGHATLASAHRLWQIGEQDPILRFSTRSGELRAKKIGQEIELDFPALEVSPVPAPENLMKSLGIEPTPVFRAGPDYLVDVTERQLLDLKPDFRQLAEITCRGIIFTSLSSDKQYDFRSRFFAPGAGIDEDPVTGSAHCALIMYWSKILGRTDLVGHQASKRGGVVKVRLEGSRAKLLGSAVTTWEGNFLIDS
jgi:PhzF family phenazine biosynthesis protein